MDAIIQIEDDLNEAIAIADVVMSAFCDNSQAPANESVCYVMGTLYQRLKNIKNIAEASKG